MVVPRSPITNGKDFNFFAKVEVAQTEFPTECQVIFNFRYQLSFSLMNEGVGVIEYSFNGNTLHGDLTPGKPSEALFFDNRRISKIWFRTAAGSSTVRIEAWAA